MISKAILLRVQYCDEKRKKDGYKGRVTDTKSKGHNNEMRKFSADVVCKKWGILYMRHGSELKVKH